MPYPPGNSPPMKILALTILMKEINETVEQKKVVRLTQEGIGGLSTELHLRKRKDTGGCVWGKKEGRKTDDNYQRHSTNTENDRDRI